MPIQAEISWLQPKHRPLFQKVGLEIQPVSEIDMLIFHLEKAF
jgi:hypothetical protein